MQTNEIREKYLEFFKAQGHTICPSDVLVPKWDPTVLFTPAGMNPFKDHFLGKVELEFTRAASCQKCLRTGDIENVGRTAYHHTFFEMLGNFSFGDYFKREAIHWAWEFLTDPRWLGVDPERLTVSVYQDDKEAADIWHDQVGLPSSRIAYLGEHDNFWPAGAPTDGPDGVCGPCSEIFYIPENGVECEIWNLVFTQFNRSGQPPDNLQPLPGKNIDTGMGLERMAATLQGVETNFHIDILRPVVEGAARVCRVPYAPETENGRRLRRIADHVRACTMAIHENVYPGTQKENYTIRRLLRRAVLQGHEMGLREPFLFEIVPAVVKSLEYAWPELLGTQLRVGQAVRAEEENFFRTLDDGLARIEKLFAKMRSSGANTVDGRAAFDLYQEQGIPAELFESIARQHSFGFDWDGYYQARDQHTRDSGAGQKGVMGDFGPLDTIKREFKSTEFLGYACTQDQGTVCGLVDDSDLVDSLAEIGTDQLLVLDRTPFYAESGGQVGDTGLITGPQGTFVVTDVQKSGALFVHCGHIDKGSISRGDQVVVEVDEPRRSGIQRAHTATHILHYALQQTLGEHAQQRGSRVEDDQLRFDFSNQESIAPADLGSIEQDTIERISESCEVDDEILPLDEARRQGAMMLFGEKYPDPVRMVSIGTFSKELCGGTHVRNTSEIGEFEIVSEEAVSAGTRRIVALTGVRARQHAEAIRETAQQIGQLLGCNRVADLPDRVLSLTDCVKALKKQLKSGQSGNAVDLQQGNAGSDEPEFPESYSQLRDIVRGIARMLNVPVEQLAIRIKALQDEATLLQKQIRELDDVDTVTADELLERGFHADGLLVIVSEAPAANVNLMRGLIDQVRQKNPSVAIFLASIQGVDKIMLLAGLGRDAVARGLNAGEWIKSVAPAVGGKGGGRPDMAQAGGKQPEKMADALEAARQFMLAATAT